MRMLDGKDDYLLIFRNRWEVGDSFGNPVPIYNNDNVVYANNDFDRNIFEQKELDYLATWVKELKLEHLGADGISVYDAVSKTKRNPYKQLKENEYQYFNRASWLSLYKKGEILLEAFKTQFYPKITKVHSTQKRSTFFINGEDSIGGVVDMILEIEGYDKPIIFDLKTAAHAYTDNQINLTDQLTTYAAMESSKYNTDLVGYVVLIKNIPKLVTATCKSCGYSRDGRHHTCNNLVNGTRCCGEWAEKKVPNPEVQVLVRSKTQGQINSMIEDVEHIIRAMKNKTVYKNSSKCYNWYGSKCPYFEACHNNDMNGLFKKKFYNSKK